METAMRRPRKFTLIELAVVHENVAQRVVSNTLIRLATPLIDESSVSSRAPL
jgi:hypothetical protein